MMRFLADENLDNRILRGLWRENTAVDILRAQDTKVYQADDPAVLEFAAQEERILLTHDLKPMPKYVFERVKAGLPMPGAIAINLEAPIGEVIEDILVVLGTSEEGEFENQVVYLPL